MTRWHPAGSSTSPMRLWPYVLPLPLYHSGGALAVPQETTSANPPKCGLAELSWLTAKPGGQQGQCKWELKRERGSKVCPFAGSVFHLSHPFISLRGLKTVKVGLYPPLDLCCQQIHLQIQAQNDEIHLCHFITKSMRLLCQRLLFPCIYKDKLEEIPHF